jgi:hypothetical protein
MRAFAAHGAAAAILCSLVGATEAWAGVSFEPSVTPSVVTFPDTTDVSRRHRHAGGTPAIRSPQPSLLGKTGVHIRFRTEPQRPPAGGQPEIKRVRESWCGAEPRPSSLDG